MFHLTYSTTKEMQALQRQLCKIIMLKKERKALGRCRTKLNMKKKPKKNKKRE